MRDPQTLPQMLHLWVVSQLGLLVRSGVFLRARFSMAAFVRFSSPVFSCCFRELLHLGRSAARASQWSGSICRAFMSLLQTSLNLSCGRPVVLFPAANSPYRRSLGILPSSIRCTCQSQRSLRCRRRVNMVGRLARERTSVFGTLSSHDMPRMRRRQRM